jgi:hypothetical protein
MVNTLEKTHHENRVKIFREKNPENLGMKTWIPTSYSVNVQERKVLNEKNLIETICL